MAATSPTKIKTADVPKDEVELKREENAKKVAEADKKDESEKTPAAPTAEGSAPQPAIPELKPEDVPREPDGIIDMETLGQIREMDDVEDDEEEAEPGETRSFSRGIVWGFFEQAEGTFDQMAEALVVKDLAQLSSLGHFLKGSSAALGIVKVQANCEKMQHYGHLRDEEVGEAIKAEDALQRIEKLLVLCRKDYALAKAWLVRLYEEGDEEEQA